MPAECRRTAASNRAKYFPVDPVDPRQQWSQSASVQGEFSPKLRGGHKSRQRSIEQTVYEHKYGSSEGAPVDQAGDEKRKREEHAESPQHEPSIEQKRKCDVLEGVAQTDQHDNLPARPGQRLEPRPARCFRVGVLGMSRRH
jgi:hypothetical protein